MIKLINTLNAWGTAEFKFTLQQEIKKIDIKQLPLQQGLSQSSYVSDAEINILILNISETEDDIIAKIGIYYAGVIAGSCCADDPTPISELNEYCEVQFKISKLTAETTLVLLE